MADLRVKTKCFEFRNPTVLVSGVLSDNADILKRVYHEGGAGAVTIKSIGPEERHGHNNPTILKFDYGFLNAVGLPSPGYKNMEGEWEKLAKRDFPLIASIYGSTVENYAEVAEFVAKKKPEILELNISCPNLENHGVIFGLQPEVAAGIVEGVKAVSGRVPVMPKLTPQALNIAAVAKACEEAGADAIAAINTVGPGMAINIDAKKPMLYNKKGGISGPAIKPIAVRCVYEIFEAVNIPIIGMGGISTGRDIVEIMQAGAAAVGSGSATYMRGMDVFKKMCDELNEWLDGKGYSRASELVGIAHD